MSQRCPGTFSGQLESMNFTLNENEDMTYREDARTDCSDDASIVDYSDGDDEDMADDERSEYG